MAESTWAGSRRHNTPVITNGIADSKRPSQYEPLSLMTSPFRPPPVSMAARPNRARRALAVTSVIPVGTSRGAAAARTTL